MRARCAMPGPAARAPPIARAPQSLSGIGGRPACACRPAGSSPDRSSPVRSARPTCPPARPARFNNKAVRRAIDGSGRVRHTGGWRSSLRTVPRPIRGEMMDALLGLSRVIDRANEWIGKAMGWLILLAVLVSAGNAVIRKVFSVSSNAWLELQWYLFGAAFMLAAAYTLKQNEHIRVDVFYGSRAAAPPSTGSTCSAMSSSSCPSSSLMAWLLVALHRAGLPDRRDLDQCRRADHLAGAGADRCRVHPARASGALRDHQEGRGDPRPDRGSAPHDLGQGSRPSWKSRRWSKEIQK